MKTKMLAIYERPDTYRGYSKINHYHQYCKLVCERLDFSEERQCGIFINDQPAKDLFSIVAYNYKDDVVYRYNFNNRDDANTCLLRLLKGQNYRRKGVKQ